MIVSKVRFVDGSSHGIEKAMQKIEPKQNETPLAFVERADAVEASDDAIDNVLKSHFGFKDEGKIKELKLQSKVFWEQFYLNQIQSIFHRQGARYAAIKFIQRKNAFADVRRKLSDADIESLVDSVGEWQR